MVPQFNPNARMRVDTPGSSGTPVIVIDDALSNAQALRQSAAMAQFVTPPHTLYPGLNAPLSKETVLGVVQGLRPALKSVYAVPIDYNLNCFGYFGLVTTPPESLSVQQAIPHYDVNAQASLAILIYLCDEYQGGTGFYRHRATGFDTVGLNELNAFSAALTPELAERTSQTQSYFNDSDGHFERIGWVEAQFNRLIVYNSNRLHSGIVDETRLSADPLKGRLTANIFVNA